MANFMNEHDPNKYDPEIGFNLYFDIIARL